MTPIQRDLDSTLSAFERGLNVAGYVPFVSSISGPCRVVYGKVLIIGSIVAAALLALNGLSRARNAAERQQVLKDAVEIFATYAIHGVANIFRGAIESILLLSLITCLPYDLSGQRFTYPYEPAMPRQPISFPRLNF
jgi:hypothetical protein